MSYPIAEVLGRVERRRRFSVEQKVAVLAEATAPGANMSEVARRHGLLPAQVYKWRRLAELGIIGMPGASELPSFVAVEITKDVRSLPALVPEGKPAAVDGGPRRRRRKKAGLIEIELGGAGAGARRTGAAMIPVPSGVRVWLAVGRTDMRKGMNGLALQVQQVLGRDPHAGDLYVFRGLRGDLIKIVWHDGIGMSLYAKRLERGRFIWPSPADGIVAISAAQLAYMLDGIDWRNPVRTWRPEVAG
jgi:transposase